MSASECLRAECPAFRDTVAEHDRFVDEGACRNQDKPFLSTVYDTTEVVARQCDEMGGCAVRVSLATVDSTSEIGFFSDFLSKHKPFAEAERGTL